MNPFKVGTLPFVIGVISIVHFVSPKPLAFSQASVAVPMDSSSQLWKPSKKIIKFRCKDFKLFAQSLKDPKITFPLAPGLVSEENCKKSIKELEDKGCFCDEGSLRCLEAQSSQPWGVVCPTGFLCYEIHGKRQAFFKVSELGNHYTRQACEKELKETTR